MYLLLQLVLVFSFLYIRYFQSRYESQVCSTLTSVAGLAVALLTCALIPVDIFLVSFMKDQHGQFKVLRAQFYYIVCLLSKVLP